MRKRFMIAPVLLLALVVFTFLRSGDRSSDGGHRVATAPAPDRSRAVERDRRSMTVHRPDSGVVLHTGMHEQMVAGIVERLNRETPQESVRKLDQVQEYFSPGTTAETDIMYFRNVSELSERFMVESVLSNRRFLKVLGDLSRMPKDEAGQLVSDELESTLRDYRKEEVKRIEMARKWMADRSSPGGFGFQASNNQDESPTFEGLRLKLLALALCAGSLELSDSRPAILDLTSLALDQRKKLRDENFLDEGLRMGFARTDTIYSSRILATALVGTSPAGLHDILLDATQSPQWDQIPLPMYNTDRTPAETLPRSTAGAAGADFSMGRQLVVVRKLMTDEEFDQIHK